MSTDSQHPPDAISHGQDRDRCHRGEVHPERERLMQSSSSSDVRVEPERHAYHRDRSNSFASRRSTSFSSEHGENRDAHRHIPHGPPPPGLAPQPPLHPAAPDDRTIERMRLGLPPPGMYTRVAPAHLQPHPPHPAHGPPQYSHPYAPRHGDYHHSGYPQHHGYYDERRGERPPYWDDSEMRRRSFDRRDRDNGAYRPDAFDDRPRYANHKRTRSALSDDNDVDERLKRRRNSFHNADEGRSRSHTAPERIVGLPSDSIITDVEQSKPDQKCPKCGEMAQDSDSAIECSECHERFHKSCVSVYRSGDAVRDWRCASCGSKKTDEAQPSPLLRTFSGETQMDVVRELMLKKKYKPKVESRDRPQETRRENGQDAVPHVKEKTRKIIRDLYASDSSDEDIEGQIERFDERQRKRVKVALPPPSSGSDADTDSLISGQVKRKKKRTPVQIDQRSTVAIGESTKGKARVKPRKKTKPSTSFVEDTHEDVNEGYTDLTAFTQKRRASSAEEDEDFKPEPATVARLRRQSSAGSNRGSPGSSTNKTTAAGRVCRVGSAGTGSRKSVYLDAEHILEEELVKWFKPYLKRMIELYVRKAYCEGRGREWREQLVADFCYLALMKKTKIIEEIEDDISSKYDFSEDELLDKLAYFTLCKCLILVTTYFRFYTTDEATSDEANPANCEDGWTPYQRPIKSFLLDSWMFAAKGSQPPTISQMVDSVNWRDLEGGDRKAWAVCCQLQTWCTADVVALKLNLLFTPDYGPLEHAKAIIHAVKSTRYIRSRVRISQVKNTHHARKLITDRIISIDWCNNPHVPPSVREAISADHLLGLTINKESLTQEEREAAKGDMQISHEEFYEQAQGAFSEYKYKPRVGGTRRTKREIEDSEEEVETEEVTAKPSAMTRRPKGKKVDDVDTGEATPKSAKKKGKKVANVETEEATPKPAKAKKKGKKADDVETGEATPNPAKKKGKKAKQESTADPQKARTENQANVKQELTVDHEGAGAETNDFPAPSHKDASPLDERKSIDIEPNAKLASPTEEADVVPPAEEEQHAASPSKPRSPSPKINDENSPDSPSYSPVETTYSDASDKEGREWHNDEEEKGAEAGDLLVEDLRREASADE